jgi:hypothetical protein
MAQTLEEKRAYLREWRRRNPEKQKAISQRANAKATPEKRAAQYRRLRAQNERAFRHRGLMSKYGITIEQYETMLAQQRGVCAVCASAPSDGKPLDVDHCHTTNVVRGLLCNPCNMALGLLKDDPLRIRALETYINGFAWLK